MESHGKGQQSWTVKAASDPRGKDYFRVRIADAGYRVGLVYRDDSGARREPYCCYLSASEWKSAKKGTLKTFAGLVTAKIEPTKADLIRRVQSLAS